MKQEFGGMRGFVLRSALTGSLGVLLASLAAGCAADTGPVDGSSASGDGAMQGEFTGAEAVGAVSQQLGMHPLGALEDTPADMDAKLITMAPPTSALPTAVDLSAKLPPVGDQGNQGSCVGWATAYAAKTYQEKLEQDGSLDLSRYQYSPSWIYNQVNGGVDHGTTISAALNLITQKGADTLAFFPYSDANFTAQPSAASLTRAARFKAASWSTLSNNVTTLKQVVASGQPVIIRLEVLPDFDALNSTTNTVYDTDQGTRGASCPTAPCSRGGHALTITGYDDAKQAFKFRNSWGSSFGVNGDAWIAYSFITNPNLHFGAYVMNDAKNAAPMASPNLYAVQASQLLRVDKEFGDWAALSTDWTGATSGVALNGSLYIIQSGQLLKATSAGAWSRLGSGDWSGPTQMSTLNGSLYVIQSNKLLLVNTASGAWSQVGNDTWGGATTMAGVNGKLFIIAGGKLYRVDPASGITTSLGAGWDGPAELAALDGGLYAVQSDQLLSVDQTSGAYARLGTGLYQNVSAMTGINGKLYIVHDGNLVLADKAGAWQVLGPRGAWAGTNVLMSLN